MSIRLGFRWVWVGLLTLGFADRLSAQCPPAAEREVLGHRTYDVVGLDKSVLAVGLPYADDLGEGSGAVVVYRDNGRNWVGESRLTASDGSGLQSFGEVVVVEGERIFVGVPHADFDGIYNAGAVYVFRHEDGVWIEEAKLTSTRATGGGLFGSTVAAKHDVLVAGVGYSGDVKEALIFRYDGAQWNLEQTLRPPVNYFNNRFGATVAVSRTWIAVADTSIDADGRVIHVYEQENGVWVLKNVLGHHLAAAFSARGKRLLSGGTHNVGIYPNSAILLKKQGNGWFQEAELVHHDGRDVKGFGNALSLGKNDIIVGAAYRDTPSYAYVYSRGDEGWTQSERIRRGDYFGDSVALSGNTFAVGDGGYVFELCPLHVECEQITGLNSPW